MAGRPFLQIFLVVGYIIGFERRLLVDGLFYDIFGLYHHRNLVATTTGLFRCGLGVGVAMTSY